MDEAIKQRVKRIVAEKCISVNALAKELGVIQKTLNEQINGNGNISLTTVLGLLSYYPEISAEWLLRGEGNQSRGYRDDKGTEIHIDASGDHIQGNNNKNTIGASSEELIELRVENKLLKEQVEDLRKDKDNLTKLLLK